MAAREKLCASHLCSGNGNITHYRHMYLCTASGLEIHAREQYPCSVYKFYVCVNVCQNAFSCENCVVIVEGIIFLEKCMKTFHMQMDNPEV